MLTQTDPLIAFFVGLVAGAGILLLVAFLYRKRWAETEQARQRIEAVAVKGREILAASPDGLFIWDRVSGSITCSRRLASLLGLSEGTKSRFDDVVAKFETNSAKRLDAAVRFLHEEERSFDLVLSTAESGGRRLIQAIGTQAQGRNGDVLVDMVWMRDISTAAKLLVDLTGDSDLPEARDLHLRGLLDALPFPIWLRDADLKVVFTNQAALSQRIAGPDDDQAKTAQSDGRPVTAVRDVENAGDARRVEITECPLVNDGAEDDEDGETTPPMGLIGYAIPLDDKQDQDSDIAPPERSAELIDAGTTAVDATSIEDRISPAMAQAALGGLGTGIALFNGDTRLAFHNMAFREMWRLDGEWLDEGRDFGELLEHLRAERRLPEVPDFRAYKVEQLQLFDDAGGPQSDPIGDLMHLPDGRTLRAVTYALPGGGLAFVYDDVTDQLDLESAVNARDAVHRATLEHLSQAVAVFGSDGRLKLFNTAFADLWQLPPDTLSNETHVTDFIDAIREHIDAEDDWDTKRAEVHAAMTRREATTARIELTDGRALEYANGPLPDGGTLISYKDVTESRGPVE